MERFFLLTIDHEVKGAIEAQRKAEQVMRDLHGSPMVEAMRNAALIVQRDAMVNAPVDTGRLRASITPDVRMAGNDVIGVVGSNVIHAPFMELGTRPHWPPISALETWARRHGMNAYVVARAIARRGLKARRYLQRAFEDNRTRILEAIERGVRGIVERR